MGKRAFQGVEGVSRKDCLLFPPEDLKLITDKEHPLYDPRVEGEPDDSLVDSILFDNQGVLKPIIINKDGDSAVVVDGRQRVKAARIANKRLKKAGSPLLKVPCVLFRGDDKALCGVSISTNEIRRDDDILTRAKKAGNLLAMGYTEKEIAKLFGVTYQSIGNWLAINDLDTKVKGLIKDGGLAATLAMKLSKIEKSKQFEAAQEYLTEKATAKKTGKRQKRNKANPLNQKKMRGRKEIEALLKIFDAKHEGNYRDLIKWILGDDKMEGKLFDEE